MVFLAPVETRAHPHAALDRGPAKSGKTPSCELANAGERGRGSKSSELVEDVGAAACMSYSDVAATPSDAAVSVCNIATHAILMAPMVLAARRHQYGLAAPSVAFDRAHNVGCIVRMAAQLVEVLVGALVDAAPPRRTPFYLTLLNHTALAYGGLLGGALPIGRTGDCHERRAVAGLGDGGGI